MEDLINEEILENIHEGYEIYKVTLVFHCACSSNLWCTISDNACSASSKVGKKDILLCLTNFKS